MHASTPSPRPPIRRRRRLLLLAVGLLLPCALIEITLRVVDPAHTAETIEREHFTEAILERGSGGALALRKGAAGTLLGHRAEIGAQGFRTPPFDPHKAQDTYRILVIGDSVAFGWGVAEQDSFPRVIERELQKGVIPGGKARVEVIDAAVPGWGVPHYLQLLEQQGLSWQPDLVLVTQINNDLTDILDVLDPTPRSQPFLLPSFLRWSYLARIVERTIAVASSRDLRSDFFVAIDVDPARRAKATTALCEAFARMQSDLGKIPLCVMDTIIGSKGERLDDFVACAKQRGFTRIDASLARPDYKTVYAVSPTDDHPNAAGHRELARIALDWIRSR